MLLFKDQMASLCMYGMMLKPKNLCTITLKISKNATKTNLCMIYLKCLCQSTFFRIINVATTKNCLCFKIWIFYEFFSPNGIILYKWWILLYEVWFFKCDYDARENMTLVFGSTQIQWTFQPTYTRRKFVSSMTLF